MSLSCVQVDLNFDIYTPAFFIIRRSGTLHFGWELGVFFFYHSLILLYMILMKLHFYFKKITPTPVTLFVVVQLEAIANPFMLR